MEAQNASKADSDDNYLDDVVVQAATERLEREFADNDSVTLVFCDRFEHGQKSDYITVAVDSDDGYTLAGVVQDAIDTGAVKLSKLEPRSARFLPTEN